MTKRALGPWSWALVALALSTPFWSLSHPLVEVDDARYAEVPREMVVGGDWATPHLDGLDYVEKPPLWYWTCAVSYKLFGVGETQARLAMGVYSLAALLGTLWLGWWLFSPAAGALATALLSSAGLFFFLEHYLTPDLPLTACLLWSAGLLLRALERPEDARWAAPLAWACAGLAFLAKGLIGLVFPGVWTVALLVLYPRYRRAALSLLRPLGPALSLAIAVPWYLLMERRHPGFLRFIFVEQHFQRFLTQKYNRSNPWWFFLAALPACVLPWTPAFLDGLARAARRWREQRAPAALALWVLIIVAFFSKSQSKLITYILPVAPQCALLAAWTWDAPARWARRLALALAALLGLASIGALIWARAPIARALEGWSGAGAALGLGCAMLDLLAFGLLAFGLESRRRVAAIAAGWLVGAVALVGLRKAAPLVSAKDLGAAVAQEAGPNDEVWTFSTYIHGLPFYSGRRVDRVVDWIGELHYAKRDPANAGRFGVPEDLRALPLPGKGVVVVMKTREARRFLTYVDGEKAKDNREVGPWSVLKF